MSEEKVHPNVKSTGSEKASQVMGNLIWNLSNKAVLFSGLLKEGHPQNENIHAKLQREEREGNVVQEGKVDYRAKTQHHSGVK